LSCLVKFALLAEPLVAFEALKVLARLAVVNASFVVAQRPVAVEPSQTLVALRSVVAIEDRCLARLLVLVLDLRLELAQLRRHRNESTFLILFCVTLFLFGTASACSCSSAQAQSSSSSSCEASLFSLPSMIEDVAQI
jgi:hypothetical protein